MRHLFHKWASYNQLMTTSTSNNLSQNSLPIAMSSHQRVPIIEEEEFDVDNEGSFCLVSID